MTYNQSHMLARIHWTWADQIHRSMKQQRWKDVWTGDSYSTIYRSVYYNLARSNRLLTNASCCTTPTHHPYLKYLAATLNPSDRNGNNLDPTLPGDAKSLPLSTSPLFSSPLLFCHPHVPCIGLKVHNRQPRSISSAQIDIVGLSYDIKIGNQRPRLG